MAALQTSECHLFKVYTTKECTDMLTAKSEKPVLFDVGILGHRARSAAGEDGAEPHQLAKKLAGGTLPGRTIGPNRGSNTTDDLQSGEKPTRRPSAPNPSLDQATQSTHGSIRLVSGRSINSI